MLGRSKGTAPPVTEKAVGVAMPSFFGDSYRDEYSEMEYGDNVDGAGSANRSDADGSGAVGSFDGSPPALPAPRVLKQGFLQKAGRHGKLIWRGRWFVLETDVLCYYTSEKEVGEGKKPKPKGVISLHGSFVQKAKDPLGFKLLTPKRIYAFKAESAYEAQLWIKELSSNMSPLRNSISSDLAEGEGDGDYDEQGVDDTDFRSSSIDRESELEISRTGTWRDLGHASNDGTVTNRRSSGTFRGIFNSRSSRGTGDKEPATPATPASPAPRGVRGLRGGLRGASSSNAKGAQAAAPSNSEEAAFEGGGGEGRHIAGGRELQEFVPVGEGIALPNAQTIAQRSHAASQVKPLTTASPKPPGGTTSIRTAESERSGSLISTGL